MKLKDLLPEYLLENSTQTYNFGCVMLYFDFPEIEQIHKIIESNDIYYEDADMSFGLEDNPHCTLLYGLHDIVTLNQVQSITDSFTYGNCELYNVSIFESNEYDVLKFNVRGKNLNETNTELKKLPHTSDYPNYQPHLTISYLQKGTGKKYVEKLKNNTYVVASEHIIVSEVNGDSTKLSINITEGSSAEYYRNNPDARKKKQAYDAKLNKRPEQVKKRVETNKARRHATKAGKDIKGKDASHTKYGIRFKESAKNRGSKTDSVGDRRARGGKKKK